MSVSDWCFSGDHENCHRESQRFIFEQRKGKSVLVWLDEWIKCECKKRGCKCYVKPAERTKKKTTRRKRKS